MRSLFWRIFLSFWLAQALIVVLAILATLALGRPASSRWEYLRASIGARVVSAYEHGGEVDARKALEELQQRLHVRAYLFDDQGQEVSRRPPPDWAVQELHGERPHKNSLRSWFSQRYVSQSIAGPSGRAYTFVAELPPSSHYVFFGRQRIPGIGIGIAVLSSGLVCYLLAWYLTAPIAKLRAATRRLASGDLSARAGGPRDHRHDEIGGLVRDFDAMAERLEKLVNAQSRLLKDISHELRSPLARLSVALGLARQRTGAEAETALQRIEVESARLNELIGRLLTVTRLDVDAELLRRSPLNLAELLADVVKDANYEAQARNCRVEYQAIDDCVVEGDASLLRSAVENVVRNAARYTREGTTVQVTLSRENHSQALIRVSDSGPGVPEESLDKLFQPFYRLDDARVRETGGVGLGLAITERAIRAHGGSVRAFNSAEGGLVVELRLPSSPPSELGSETFASTESR